MAKKRKKGKKKDQGAGAALLQERKHLKTLTDHNDQSDRYVSPYRSTWDEKEALLTGTLKDDYSENEAKSQVFDPRLSTIVLERAARVMGQLPSGKSLAVSRDDKGKNMLMNMCVDKYVLPNADSQWDYLIKSRLMDVYSLVYGSMFGLVDWRVDEQKGYIGPDYWLLPIRDVFPMPGAVSVNECDWFQVSSMVTIDWLKQRDKKTWKNIDDIITELKDGHGKSRSELDSERQSHTQSKRHPDIAGNMVELITEYRRTGGKDDKGEWVTWAVDFHDRTKGQIVRHIDNPHSNGEIPIVCKYGFPLIDSIFGLGEFERGKTLQYAINSLINLYLDGVKQSLFPPILVNPNNVIKSSIKWQPAAKWLVKDQNAINQLNLSPQGLNTFQSTYSFLIAALLNQAGTTDTSVSRNTDPGLGKTPQALELINQRENSRDSWDRFMMEKTQEEILRKFVNLLSHKQEKPIKMRLFAAELEEIAQMYPDVVDVYEGAERGEVKIGKGTFDSSDFDYEIVSGSTVKADEQQELQNLVQIFGMVSQNPTVLQMMNQEGKTINMAELLTRLISSAGINDWDKIITDFDPSQITDQQIQETVANFQDPDVQATAQQILSNLGEVPENVGQPGFNAY